MMSNACTALLLLGLVATSALGSAIKGYQQTQPAQRADEQTRLASPVKSPALQQLERSPKSAPAATILESSKKVYNDESIRRLVSQQQALEPAAVAGKSYVHQAAAQPAAEQAAAAHSAPGAAKDSAQAEPAKAAPVAVHAQAAPAGEQSPKAAEAPGAAAAAKPADELPAQSARSAPVKDEFKPQAALSSSPVLVEQVVPAKVPVVEQAPVVASAQPPQQQAPVVAEPKPAAPEPQVQPAPAVPVVQSQPEPVVEPLKPAGVESALQAKKDEPAAKDSNEPIEVPAPDPGLILSDPIDSTTKLLIDLDEHVQKFLPAEDKQEPAQPSKDQVLVSGVDYSPQAQAGDAQPSGKSNAPLVPYSSNVESEPIVPPLPSSLDKVEKASGVQSPPSPTAGTSNGQSATRQASNHQNQNQQQVITQLLDQLDSLQNRIQDTINQLVARRRYVMSALLRPMGTYVRRVRTNLERLQNRVNQLQAAASSVGNNTNQRPGGFVDAAAIETIRRRIDDISKRISDIVNRIRFSLTPTSAPLNSNGRK